MGSAGSFVDLTTDEGEHLAISLKQRYAVRGMQDFRKLTVWHSAQDLAVEVYRATGGFPSNELYGLTSQMRRAAVSVGSNIAEACGREGPADFVRFLHYAIGSVSELLSQVDIARRLLLLTREQSNDLVLNGIAVKKQLIRLRESADQRRMQRA